MCSSCAIEAKAPRDGLQAFAVHAEKTSQMHSCASYPAMLAELGSASLLCWTSKRLGCHPYEAADTPSSLDPPAFDDRAFDISSRNLSIVSKYLCRRSSILGPRTRQWSHTRHPKNHNRTVHSHKTVAKYCTYLRSAEAFAEEGPRNQQPQSAQTDGASTPARQSIFCKRNEVLAKKTRSADWRLARRSLVEGKASLLISPLPSPTTVLRANHGRQRSLFASRCWRRVDVRCGSPGFFLGFCWCEGGSFCMGRKSELSYHYYYDDS